MHVLDFIHLKSCYHIIDW